ncbi:MAG: hypothetical protein F6K58_13730 [Symploca sp. SIO2E9]|nr:hypothetical protein [Symploca sp. SIO2E9]
MSEKKSGEISKQTPRRPDAENLSPTQNFLHPSPPYRRMGNSAVSLNWLSI